MGPAVCGYLWESAKLLLVPDCQHGEGSEKGGRPHTEGSEGRGAYLQPVASTPQRAHKHVLIRLWAQAAS